MNLATAQIDAAKIKRHPCMRVDLIVNGVGMLREMGIEPPPFSMRATAWLLMVRHEGEDSPTLIASDSAVDQALLESCWDAMVKRGMGSLNPVDINAPVENAPEVVDDDWRCPEHEMS